MQSPSRQFSTQASGVTHSADSATIVTRTDQRERDTRTMLGSIRQKHPQSTVFSGIGRLEDLQAQMMTVFRDRPALHRQVGNRGDEGFKKACQKREGIGLPILNVDGQGRFLRDEVAPPKSMRLQVVAAQPKKGLNGRLCQWQRLSGTLGQEHRKVCNHPRAPILSNLAQAIGEVFVCFAQRGQQVGECRRQHPRRTGRIHTDTVLPVTLEKKPVGWCAHPVDLPQVRMSLEKQPVCYPKPKPPRPNEPERPARVPVTRPPEPTRTVLRPNPLGLLRPTPRAPPIREDENMVGREAGV